MSRRGSSRTVGVVRQCAVYVRGGLRCVWCERRLRAPRTDGGRDTVTASIDHYDEDPSNHAADNLLPSCRTCNAGRNFWSSPCASALKRAEAQLARPLDYAAGRALAERWHPGRLEQLRRDNARYRARRRGLLPPVTEFLEAG